MSQEQLEQVLVKSLEKLEKMTEKMVNTRGYTEEVAKVKALEELIKEQLRNESTRITARQIR